MKNWFCKDKKDIDLFKKLWNVTYQNEHPEVMTFIVSRLAQQAAPETALRFKTEIARAAFSRQITDISCEHITQLEEFSSWLPETFAQQLERRAQVCPVCHSEYCPGFLLQEE